MVRRSPSKESSSTCSPSGMVKVGRFGAVLSMISPSRTPERLKTVGSGFEEDIGMSNEGRYRQRLNTLAANWRALALRGLVALLFGLVVLFWPGLVFAVLALLFGIYAVVDGAITFVPALRSSERGARRWLPLSEGAVGVFAGLVALLFSGMAGQGLVYVIVGWAVGTGVLKILTATL